jgi:hypothetical protein
MHLDDRPSHRYSRASDLAETRVGSSYLLLHTGSWNYFEFDPVGSAIWTLLDSPRSLDELVADLTRTFAVDPDRSVAGPPGRRRVGARAGRGDVTPRHRSRVGRCAERLPSCADRLPRRCGTAVCHGRGTRTDRATTRRRTRATRCRGRVTLPGLVDPSGRRNRTKNCLPGNPSRPRPGWERGLVLRILCVDSIF